MAESLVLADRPSPGIVVLTLNRPEKRNALCVPLLEALCAELQAVEADADVRVIVLAARGPVFCAGLDLMEAQDASKAEKSAHLIAQALKLLSSARPATIAAAHGSAIAGGAGLMSACDFVVAADSAQFGYPEVHRGLVPGLVLTFLRRQLRERDIRELILMGELIDAGRAQTIGLVNWVVPADQVPTIALEKAGKLLRGAPNAIAASKRLLAELWPRGVADDLQSAHDHHMAARNSGEAAEGMRAFHEKRPPQWQAGE